MVLVIPEAPIRLLRPRTTLPTKKRKPHVGKQPHRPHHKNLADYLILILACAMHTPQGLLGWVNLALTQASYQAGENQCYLFFVEESGRWWAKGQNLNRRCTERSHTF